MTDTDISHIGEKLKEAVMHYRQVQEEARRMADAIEKLWEKWDVVELVNLRVLTWDEADEVTCAIENT